RSPACTPCWPPARTGSRAPSGVCNPSRQSLRRSLAALPAPRGRRAAAGGSPPEAGAGATDAPREAVKSGRLGRRRAAADDVGRLDAHHQLAMLVVDLAAAANDAAVRLAARRP